MDLGSSGKRTALGSGAWGQEGEVVGCVGAGCGRMGRPVLMGGRALKPNLTFFVYFA